MKTRSKYVYIIGRVPTDDTNAGINIRTDSGKLMLNKLICLIKKHKGKLITDSRLVYDLAVNYRKKSKRVKVLEAEIERLKARK